MLLGLVFITPLILSLLLFSLKNSKNALSIAKVGSLLVMVLGIALVFSYSNGGNQPVLFSNDLLKWLDIDFTLKMDGLGAIMVLMTTLLMPIIVFTDAVKVKEKSFYGLTFLMQMALIGVFTAQDVLLFYIFWELALIPIYFITGLWGGKQAREITIKFFIYTLAGSLFMLMAILYLYTQTSGGHSFAFSEFYKIELSAQAKILVSIAFFIAFSIKIPIFPFHTWQPDTYTVAPVQGSMLLGALMGKMGLFGFLRLLLPIACHDCGLVNTLFIVLAVTGLIYAAIISINQKDFKRLIAYSSISHVGLMAVALLVNVDSALKGSILQMFAHAVNVTALFYIYHILITRTGTSEIANLGGIALKAPRFATFFIIVVLANVALPLTNAFVGEFMMLLGLFNYSPWLAFAAGTSVVFGAVYMLWATQRILYGPENTNISFADLNRTEISVLTILSALIIIPGVCPNLLLNLVDSFITTAF